MPLKFYLTKANSKPAANRDLAKLIDSLLSYSLSTHLTTRIADKFLLARRY